MMISTKRRLLSLLLALALMLSAAPTALLADNPDGGGSENTEEGGDESQTPDDETPGGEETPDAVTKINLGGDSIDRLEVVEAGKEYNLILEPNSTQRGSVQLTVDLEPVSNQNENRHVIWTSSDSSVAAVEEQSDGQRPGQGHIGFINGKNPGAADVTITAGELKCVIHVEVSGVKLSDQLEKEGLRLAENEPKVLKLNTDYFLFGSAKKAEMSAREINSKTIVFIPTINSNESITVEGRREGTGTLLLTATYGGMTSEKKIPLTVIVNETVIDWTTGVSPTSPLKFSALEAAIAQKCLEMTNSTLSSITELTVSTDQGIIYHGYKSPDDTGTGAGSALTYYAKIAENARGPYIEDLTFVPNASFTGSTAEITFSGTAVNGRTFRCRVNVTLADAKTEDVKLTTRSDVPLKLKAEDFIKYCQAQTGASLDYVIFTLPPANQGVLYRDYKNELDYAARVTAAEQFDRKGLDDITFVPATGYVGTVTIRYAGYSTTGAKYTGELVITVNRALDASLQYQDYGSGRITLSGADFDAYCESMTGRRMSYVSFTPPPASQGVLYRSGSAASWNTVTAGDTFGQTSLNYVTFIAAEGFNGVVRIPFTGKDWYGTDFSGTVELHIQSNSSSARAGDINYTCQPSQSVKLVVADFANLCQTTTGERLYYVTFQSLPDYTQGSLFYNRTSSGAIGTRVTTTTKYFNSATPYLNNVSFWASASFRSVEIPFTLAAVNGETFTGLLVISNGEGAGDGYAGTVTYATGYQQPVTFSGSKFDTACRQATNSALNYLRFSLPSSGQGTLYYDYKDGVTPKALDPSTALYLSGEVSVDKVTFVPANGFSGVAYVPFTATGINGTTYQGTVQISVRAGQAYGSIVRYSTGGAPVRFQSSDLLAASGIGQPTSIRLTGLPSSSQGRVFYQYSGVTKYSALGNTTVSYSVTGDPSISSLTFIPKAGYEGVVTIPYTATGYDGISSAGAIEITVTLPETAMAFDDLADQSAQTRSAVEYLSNVGVVNGTGYRTYTPDASILRGDFCLMVSRAFQFNVGGTGRTFIDVPAGSYYAKAINEMYYLGVVNGTGGGRFQPTANISRQDAAVMVRRALDKAGLTLPEGSNDAALAGYEDRAQVDNYAKDALGSLVRTGIFPVSGEQLSPKAAITRAEMAVLLHRAMTNFS